MPTITKHNRTVTIEDTIDEDETVLNKMISEVELNKFELDAVIMIPLASGRIGLLDRYNNVRELRTDVPTLDELRTLSSTWGRELRHEAFMKMKMAELGVGVEPDDKTLARDIKKANAPKPGPKRGSSQAIRITL